MTTAVTLSRPEAEAFLYKEARIRPLDPAPHLDEDVIRDSAHVVGMMGVEPLQRYHRLRRRVLGLDRYHSYDFSIPLVESECTLLGSCNVLPGAPDPCPTDGSGPPLCTTGASCE